MKKLNPQIEFSHVLGELSVNRNDPCEVLRELISNSYDAKAKNIFYSPIEENNGLIFFDDGTGLSPLSRKNGITPWEAFFSIGKSTKKKGEGIGYKCQGSKLCFACARILIATRDTEKQGQWYYKKVDAPRNNLNINFDISPLITSDMAEILRDFFASAGSETSRVLDRVGTYIDEFSNATATLIVIDNLDTESFQKYFSVGKRAEESYVWNYIRFCTSHGEVRKINKKQGFSPSQIAQVSPKGDGCRFEIMTSERGVDIPFGFPYLTTEDAETSIKTPSQISRLRDGRFFSRSAKSFNIGAAKYSIIMTIDGNRRAHDEYKQLDRKGAAKSGIRLSDQRGLFVSVKGIKICKYPEIFTLMPNFEILSEGDSPSHYAIIIDGDFDLVTNRNALSKKAYDTLGSTEFLTEILKFFEVQLKSDKVFSELLSRLKRESSETRLNEQIAILEASRTRVKQRERFRLPTLDGQNQIFLSPLPGEEYSVGVLYAILAELVPKDSDQSKFWQRIITFSTQGIDSLALRDPAAASPLNDQNINAVEYKYEFHNGGPFNHTLAIVDCIVAWSVDVNPDLNVKDQFTCFGSIKKMDGNDFEWQVDSIENTDGGVYDHVVTVLDLKKLITATFAKVKFVTPGE